MAQNPDSDLDKLFEGIEDASSTRPTSTSTHNEQDLLAGLESLAAGHPKSRPHTPAHRSRTPLPRTSTDSYSGYALPTAPPPPPPPPPIRIETPTPAPSASTSTSITSPPPPQPATAAATATNSWGWTTIWQSATAAVKDLQQSDEPKRWAQQVVHNAREVVVPTFATLLHTLVPPITAHERLRIHVVHDLVGYPIVEGVVQGIFERVMAQVEGGELVVVRKSGSAGGDVGGLWYKDLGRRELGATHGLKEGVKLARAAAEAAAREYLRIDGAPREQDQSKDNPTRHSDIFLAIQPAVYGHDGSEGEEGDEVVSFAVHLFDHLHGLSFSTVSQALPAQWLEWLDAPPPAGTAPGEWALPDVIRNIIDIGGIDPREWIVEWVEEAMGLAVGVVAQRYVAKRMRIGDSGSHGLKGKEVSSGGEEARAVAL